MNRHLHTTKGHISDATSIDLVVEDTNTLTPAQQVSANNIGHGRIRPVYQHPIIKLDNNTNTATPPVYNQSGYNTSANGGGGGNNYPISLSEPGPWDLADQTKYADQEQQDAVTSQNTSIIAIGVTILGLAVFLTPGKSNT